jgi:molecular chaperone DnaK (HSP70)
MAAGDAFPQVVANELANRFTPAVIVFDGKGRLIGEAADLVKVHEFLSII